MPRRTVPCLALTTALLTISWAYTQEASGLQTPGRPRTPSAYQPPDRGQAAAAPIRLGGKGDQVSRKFSLQAGLSTWQVAHDGTSNVQISLLGPDGRSVDMPVNEIGPYRGTLVVRVPRTNTYLLSVRADGKWAVTIRQPRPAAGTPRPLVREGKGTDVPAFVELPQGLSVFRLTHAGSGIFRVKLYDRDGKLVEQVVAHIGRYAGSRAISLNQEGLYAVGIAASGPWSLRIE